MEKNKHPTEMAIDRDYAAREALLRARRRNPHFDRIRKEWTREHQELLERMELAEREH